MTNFIVVATDIGSAAAAPAAVISGSTVYERMRIAVTVSVRATRRRGPFFVPSCIEGGRGSG